MCTQGSVPAPRSVPSPPNPSRALLSNPQVTPTLCVFYTITQTCVFFSIFVHILAHLMTHPFLSHSSEYSILLYGANNFFSFSPLYGEKYLGYCQYFAVSLRQSVTLCTCVLCCWDVSSGEGPGRGIAVSGRSRTWSVDKRSHMFLQKGSSSFLSMGRAGRCFPHCFPSPMCHLGFSPINRREMVAHSNLHFSGAEWASHPFVSSGAAFPL